MKQQILRASLIGASLTIFAPAIHASISSTFESDADGWDALTFADIRVDFINLFETTGSFAVTHNATGGNPGGDISIVDPNFGATVFRAPAKYLGDLSAYLGGTLSFDRSDEPNGASPFGDPLVGIVGAAGTAVYSAPVPAVYPAWTHYDVVLKAASWQFQENGTLRAITEAEFSAIVGGVTGLYISAEFWSPTTENSHLDNVQLTAVPLPGGLTLFAPALLALAGWRRTGARTA